MKVLSNYRYNLLVSICLILTLGYIDFITGYELSFQFFYFIPLAILSYNRRVSKISLVVFAVISAVIWACADVFAGNRYSTNMVLVWNTMSRLIVFVSFTLFLNTIVNSRRKIQELSILKESFLANISHEIRTPMNAIMGFTDLLLKREMPAKDREYLQIVKSSGENLLRIINDILDISKIDSGIMTFEEIPFSIRELFFSINSMLAQQAGAKKLQLTFECDAALPEIVLGDPLRLNQIILNLAGNAIKFTKVGTVAVYVKVLESDGSVCKVEFSVKDTGIGIPEDKLKHIFERFAQAESHTSRSYGGTGLGLSIAKQLTELQGGLFHVTSTPGKGSEFSFVLTFRIADKAALTSAKTEAQFNSFDVIGKMSILLVDDNPVNVRYITSLFEEHGMKVDRAENGQHALECIKNKSYDVVLMDIEMPILNGYEATRLIRQDLGLSVPIIAMTANAMAGEREKCIQAGMNDYLSKPIDEQELFDKILAFAPKIDSGLNTIDIPAKIINLDFLERSMRGKRATILEIIELLVKQLPVEIAILNGAVARGDFDTIKQCAHKMKSSVAIVSVVEMERILQEIELLGAAKMEIDKVKVLNAQLNVLNDQALDELKAEKVKYE